MRSVVFAMALLVSSCVWSESAEAVDSRAAPGERGESASSGKPSSGAAVFDGGKRRPYSLKRGGRLGKPQPCRDCARSDRTR